MKQLSLKKIERYVTYYICNIHLRFKYYIT